ncbi:T9SS type A sorting domain-containing protein [candidate division KSB1 bacterium]|nr:T9SS type A sorting domain-containing protein [candidate division KSB1 bacterium]
MDRGLFHLLYSIAFLFFCATHLHSQNSLDQIINDMTRNHQGLPHGVPTSYSWYTGPRIGTPVPPAGWTAAIGWGQVYEWVEGNPATNTRVQIKDMEMYYLSKADHQWHLLQEARTVFGWAYVEDFVNDKHKTADTRMEADSSISVTCGDGYNFHFWPQQGRTLFPVNDVDACFVTVQARLVLDDPMGVDDRDSARYLLNVGGDWWLDLDAQWDQWKTNRDMGIGRFRFVSSEWSSFNMITLSVERTRENPPPFRTKTRVAAVQKEDHDTFCQIYPNPIHDLATLTYKLYNRQSVQVELFNIQGQKLKSLFNGVLPAGDHILTIHTNDLVTGVYFCRVLCGNLTMGAKMVVVK